MTGFIGMDPQAVRTLATQLTANADQIDSLANALNAQLQGTQWVGQDASSFRSDWESRHRPQLAAVASALRDAATRATVNAQQQEQTSSA
ncbi:WXG100 family type VII secretion target [Actinokineospora fastidiosa]|uniref:WXG100 family type VII secretion target n=1 Tax=Actinokineospora fastidiosa TaxID=1816 RepID=A0A918GQY6_9PSEU|nr:WXG100 family type VII secretion target [Actinokineospora fastidiosa]GGS54349.1 hypothetical protein GCM10010171_56840 [Actinokineospora fastidiosa]